MTEEERQAAKEAGREGAREVFKILGLDADNPREVQEDLIFLRQWRKGSNAIKGRFFGAAIMAAVSAGAYALWIGIKHQVK